MSRLLCYLASEIIHRHKMMAELLKKLSFSTDRNVQELVERNLKTSKRLSESVPGLLDFKGEDQSFV